MDSAMIGKIIKANQYARERDRMRFDSFKVVFSGNHSNHTVVYQSGNFTCDCDFFHQRGVCSHTMAMEKVLEGMIEPSPAHMLPAMA